MRQDTPKECPDCKQTETLIPCGPGVERIHERVEKFFPGARSRIVTSDEITSPTKLNDLIQKINHHEIDILIGTQILAKGHHFPLITLVGVIDADLGLSGGDLRCGEKTFQLLHQVAGRAGREQHPGRVLLQTFQPEHPLMQAIVHQDREAFVQLELEERAAQGMPPFGRLASITLSATKNEVVARAAQELGRIFPHHASDTLRLYGPVPAPLSFVRGRFRWRLLLKSPKSFPLQSFISQWVSQIKIPSVVQVSVDIDPYNFM
jgi:primosomal protein N' (replication factor Y)